MCVCVYASVHACAYVYVLACVHVWVIRRETRHFQKEAWIAQVSIRVGVGHVSF